MTSSRLEISSSGSLARRRFSIAFVIIFLTVATILVLLPVIWTFSTSLRLPKESYQLPPKWLPTDWEWENYPAVFDAVPFDKYIVNSLKVTFSIVFGHIVTSTLAGYAFARLRFPGKKILFILFMSGLMIPLFVTIIPVFLLISEFRLVDSHLSLILPALVTPFGVFLMRQFYLTIPNELEDAAKLDGAGPFGIFWHIFLPLGRSGIAVLAVLSFNAHWNEFFRPLIFLFNPDQYTIPLGIVALRGPLDTGQLSVVLAAVAMSLVPMIVLIIFAQRFLIEGIVLTGTKS